MHFFVNEAKRSNPEYDAIFIRSIVRPPNVEVLSTCAKTVYSKIISEVENWQLYFGGSSLNI